MTERASNSKRSCIFCSATTDLSREHLLPDWLQGVFPNVDLVTHFRAIGRNDRHEWDARPFSERVRFVCVRCNNGWLSQLEAAVKPIMIPMLQHRPCVVDRRAQELLCDVGVQDMSRLSDHADGCTADRSATPLRTSGSSPQAAVPGERLADLPLSRPFRRSQLGVRPTPAGNQVI